MPPHGGIPRFGIRGQLVVAAAELTAAGPGQALRQSVRGQLLQGRPHLAGVGQCLSEGDHECGDLLTGDGHKGDPVRIDVDAQGPVPQRRAHPDSRAGGADPSGHLTLAHGLTHSPQTELTDGADRLVGVHDLLGAPGG